MKNLRWIILLIPAYLFGCGWSPLGGWSKASGVGSTLAECMEAEGPYSKAWEDSQGRLAVEWRENGRPVCRRYFDDSQAVLSGERIVSANREARCVEVWPAKGYWMHAYETQPRRVP